MSDAQTVQTPVGPAVLKRTARKTLAISVLPNGGLELTAPLDSEDSLILAKVGKRAKWIDRQRRSFAEMNATRMPRRYASGATHRYLGKQYRLKILAGEGGSVLLKGTYFHVVSPSGSQDEIRNLLNAWFRDKAKQQFKRRIAEWVPWCRRNQLPEPKLVLRRMSKRWGSAGKAGRIALSPELIHAPSPCIDYVIAHEIAHLKHPSHSPAFHRLLSSLVPNWRSLKERLESPDAV